MLNEVIFIKIKGREIPIEIKRFNNSRGLKLMGTGYNIRVTTTRLISKTKIKEILKPYREQIHTLFMLGIEEELKEQEMKDNLKLHTYVEGVSVDIVYKPLFGTEEGTEFKNRQIIIGMKEELNYKNVYKELDKLYLVMALTFLPKYFDHLLKSFGYSRKPELRIKKMMRQWGNCKKSTGVITLNSQLVKLPSELINYIIFHELAHLVQPNHGKEFYKIIDFQFPERRELDKKLKLWSFVLKDNYIEEYQGEESN